MGIVIALAIAVAMYFWMKIVWKSGFNAGRDHEAFMWLASIDKLFVPNWQSRPISDESLTEEQLIFANKVYVSAYRAALEIIKLDIANIRREELDKKYQPQPGDYPV